MKIIVRFASYASYLFAIHGQDLIRLGFCHVSIREGLLYVLHEIQSLPRTTMLDCDTAVPDHSDLSRLKYH